MNYGAAAVLLGGCILLARGWPAVAGADNEDSNPYSVISERNVFHLNPVPPPPPVAPPKAELPEIKLSGFLRIGATTHALFSSKSKVKKVEPIYYDLADGEKAGILEVVKIHEEAGEVEIVNSGTPMTLSLKNDSIKETVPATAVQASAGAPQDGRVPGTGDHFPQRPGFRPPVPGQGESAASTAFPMPTRRVRGQYGP